MPIYEYRCGACEHVFEKLMAIGAAAPDCPSCGHEDVQKLVSAAGFILKGSGWYKDHYGLKSSSSGGGGQEQSGSSGATSGSDSSSSTSSGGDA